DFASFKPYLKEVLHLVRQMANAKGDAMGMHPYDALIDQYDPGTRMQDINPLFDRLAAFLPDFIPRVLEAQARLSAPAVSQGPYDREKQETLGRFVVERLGFDSTRGRVDTSLHPFCGGVPGDV